MSKIGPLIDEAGKRIGPHEAEVLMRHLIQLSRAELYLMQDELPADTAKSFAALVERRIDGEPLQYLTGVQSFRGLELAVGPGVLVPRPETEQLVEAALAWLAGVDMPKVIDVGTGSGAIALAIAAERPDAHVWATELSEEAMGWAEQNLERTRCMNVTLVRSDLFDGLPHALLGKADLVVSNPPYLAETQLDDLPDDVLMEPRLATIGGPTGMEVAARVVAGAPAWLRPAGALFLETWPGQVDDLCAAMKERFEDIQVLSDLAGSERIVRGIRR